MGQLKRSKKTWAETQKEFREIIYKNTFESKLAKLIFKRRTK